MLQSSASIYNGLLEPELYSQQYKLVGSWNKALIYKDLKHVNLTTLVYEDFQYANLWKIIEMHHTELLFFFYIASSVEQ